MEKYRDGNLASDCLDWNDIIENDGGGFIILPDGDYDFIVKDFERARFPGGQKIPACNKAALTLQIETSDGTAYVRTDLILHKSLEWKISSFFRAIGQKKKGERMVMDWSKVLGSRGRCHVKQTQYVDKNGNTRITNDVDRYYDYEEHENKENDITHLLSANPFA